MERKNPNMNSEDDSLPSVACNLIPVMQLVKFRCVYKFWNSIHKFARKARKHFKLSTTKPSASTNPNNLPSLPFDLITEILSRLPVKTLVQLRCVCKPWNSLISDHKFSRNHFKLSTTPNLHIIAYDDPLHRYVLRSYPLQSESVFTDLTSNFTQLGFPFNSPYEHNLHYVVGSCDGILCLADYHNRFVVLWNPSIRKFKELPPVGNPQLPPTVKYGFGYDHVSHSYKVLVVYDSYIGSILEDTTKIKVYTLSTNSWRTIPSLPFPSEFCYDQSGIHIRGTINWLAYTIWPIPTFIVSFDLGNESYRKIFPPEHGRFDRRSKLCVLRDCLCIISYYDVWVMKEYGVKESWTKLFKHSNLPNHNVWPSSLTRALYIFEDNRVLLHERGKKELIIYDFKNDTFKFTTMFKSLPTICMESLISPCT